MSSNTPPVPPEGITYYELFGVEENASTDRIEQQYRRLVRMYHPDQCDLDEAEDIIKRLHSGREVLTNPRKRQSYDRQGHEMYTGEPLIEKNRNSSTSKSNNSVTIGSDGKVFNADWMRDTNESDDSSSTSSTSKTKPDSESDDKINLDGPPGESDTWDFDDLFDEEENIEDDQIKSVDKNKTTDNIDKTYQDQVKAQSQSRERRVKFSQTRQQSKTTETQEDKDEESLSTQVRGTGKQIYTGFDDTLDYVESFFRQDVISTAVRRAWISRFSITVVAFTTYLVLGIIFNSVVGTVPFFPSQEDIATSPQSQLGVLIGITVIVFLADQYKTENDVSKGNINAKSLPIKIPAVTFTLYSIATVLYVVGLSIDGEPIEFVKQLVFTLEQPTVQVWHEIFAVDAILAFIMISGIISGYLIAIPALTRHIWYDRYVNGYSVLPVIWDTALAIPALVFLWATITQIDVITIPSIVGTFFTSVMGPLAETLGITQTALPMSAVIGLLLITPIILVVLYTLRHILSFQLAD